jgi:hypothetical protein
MIEELTFIRRNHLAALQVLVQIGEDSSVDSKKEVLDILNEAKRIAKQSPDY